MALTHVTHEEARAALDNLRMNLGGDTIGTVRLAVYIGQQENDAQALADVRTLDEWATNTRPPYASATTWRVSFLAHDLWLCSIVGWVEFEAPTPDAARALAAAWVREQAKGEK